MDHKPLLGLLAGDWQLPQILSPCMSQWTEFLAAYSYQLLYRPGKNLSNADVLSCCPLPATVLDPAPAPAPSILLVETCPFPITVVEIAAHSAKGRILLKVLDIVRMKALGRSYVWWQKFNHAISEQVAGCQESNSPEQLHLLPS